MLLTLLFSYLFSLFFELNPFLLFFIITIVFWLENFIFIPTAYILAFILFLTLIKKENFLLILIFLLSKIEKSVYLSHLQSKFVFEAYIITLFTFIVSFLLIKQYLNNEKTIKIVKTLILSVAFLLILAGFKLNLLKEISKEKILIVKQSDVKVAFFKEYSYLYKLNFNNKTYFCFSKEEPRSLMNKSKLTLILKGKSCQIKWFNKIFFIFSLLKIREFCKKFKLFCLYKLTVILAFLFLTLLFILLGIGKEKLPLIITVYVLMVMLDLALLPLVILEEKRRFKKSKSKSSNNNK